MKGIIKKSRPPAMTWRWKQIKTKRSLRSKTLLIRSHASRTCTRSTTMTIQFLAMNLIIIPQERVYQHIPSTEYWERKQLGDQSQMLIVIARKFTSIPKCTDVVNWKQKTWCKMLVMESGITTRSCLWLKMRIWTRKRWKQRRSFTSTTKLQKY